jgi:hypothetical protein
MSHIRHRDEADIAACVEALRTVDQASGYPTNWPANPALAPAGKGPGTWPGHAATITHRSPVLLIRHSDSVLSSVFAQTLRRLMHRLLFSAQNGTNQHK